MDFRRTNEQSEDQQADLSAQTTQQPLQRQAESPCVQVTVCVRVFVWQSVCLNTLNHLQLNKETQC